MSKRQSILRREFLTQASVAGAAGVVGIAGMVDETFGAKPNAATGSELSYFAKRVGRKFVVEGSQKCGTEVPGKQVALVLKSATAQALRDGDLRKKGETVWVNSGNRMRMEPFTLLFAVPGGEQLEQGTYVAAHTGFTKLHLFLVPMPFKEDGTPHDEPHYLAHFN